MYVNKKIELFTKNKDWEGNITPVSLGTFDVYLEEHSSKSFEDVSGGSTTLNVSIKTSKGWFILFEDIELGDAQLTYDGKTYAIDSWDRYFFPGGDFHHIEADFK